MKELGLTLKTETPHKLINNFNRPDQSNNRTDTDITTLKGKFHKLFTENHTVQKCRIRHPAKRRIETDSTKRETHPYSLITRGRNRNRKTEKNKAISKKQKTLTKTIS